MDRESEMDILFLSLGLADLNQSIDWMPWWAWALIFLVTLAAIFWWWWFVRPVSNSDVEKFEDQLRHTNHDSHAEHMNDSDQFPFAVTTSTDLPQTIHRTEPVSVQIENLPKGASIHTSHEDDLVLIEGIGPKISQILKSHGLITFELLSKTSVEHLEKILEEEKLQMHDPGSWPKQAELAARGAMDELDALKETLKGGR
jgi:predicted flap endonuclease-1-like 5' DNA nuclease